MNPEQQFENVVRGLSTGGMFDELKVMAIVQAHTAVMNKAVTEARIEELEGQIASANNDETWGIEDVFVRLEQLKGDSHE